MSTFNPVVYTSVQAADDAFQDIRVVGKTQEGTMKIWGGAVRAKTTVTDTLTSSLIVVRPLTAADAKTQTSGSYVALDLGQGRVTNVGDGKDPTDLATIKQVTTVVAAATAAALSSSTSQLIAGSLTLSQLSGVAGAGTGVWDLGGNVLRNVADAVEDKDVTTKLFVETKISAALSTVGVLEARLATDHVDLDAAARSSSSSSVAVVLTAASGTARLVVDTVPANTGDVILVKDQADKSTNGLFVVTAQGGSGAKWSMSRLPAFSDVATITAQVGKSVLVNEGASNALSTWAFVSGIPADMSTSTLFVFAQASSALNLQTPAIRTGQILLSPITYSASGATLDTTNQWNNLNIPPSSATIAIPVGTRIGEEIELHNVYAAADSPVALTFPGTGNGYTDARLVTRTTATLAQGRRAIFRWYGVTISSLGWNLQWTNGLV